jgi:Putative restriction endonuclease
MLPRPRRSAAGLASRGHRPATYQSTHDAADIHAVIEAVSEDSDGHEDQDAVEKLRVYASLGIAHYWVVRGDMRAEEIDGFVTMYELADGEYRLVGQRLVSQLAGSADSDSSDPAE